MKNFFLKKNNKNHGFTIVEVLVALAIFSLSVVAMVVTLSSGITNTDYVNKNLTATYLAQEGIEYVRNVRDDYMLYHSPGYWNDFTTMVQNNNCYGNLDCGIDDIGAASSPVSGSNIKPCGVIGLDQSCNLYLHSDGSYGNQQPSDVSDSNPPSFTRVLHFSVNDPEEVTVTSIVTWQQGTSTHQVSFTEYLYNWYPNA